VGEADATAAKRRHGRPVVTSAAVLVATSIGATGKPGTVHNILGIDTAGAVLVDAVGLDADHVTFRVGEHANVEGVAQSVGPEDPPPRRCAHARVASTSATAT